MSEILVIYLKITDPTDEIADEGNRKRNNDLVLGTMNILSYVILMFSFFSYGETEVSLMR